MTLDRKSTSAKRDLQRPSPTFNDLGKAVNPRDIPVVTVHDFTKFRIPPTLSFELEKISQIFLYPGAENLIHPLLFPDIFPWLPYPRGKPMTCALELGDPI